MLYSLPSATGYQLPGLKTLLLAPWSGAALYSYASADLSHLTNFSGLSGWEYVSCEPGAAEFGQVLATTKNGTTATQTVSLSLAGLSADQRTAVVALLAAGPVVALCQDYGGQWWLYGQTAGLRLLTAGAAAGTLSLSFAGIQRDAARTVARSRVALLYNFATTFHLPA